MKITLLTESFPPERGGIQNYLKNIAEQLARTHDVIVLTPYSSDSSPPSKGGARGGYQVKRTNLRIPLLKPAWLLTYIKLHRQAKRGEVQLLLAGKALFEGLLGYYLKKHTGTPYIIFTYAMEIKTWAANPRTCRKLQRALGSADKVVYINDITKQHLKDLGVTDEQLLKLPPGIDDRFFNFQNSSPRSSGGVRGGYSPDKKSPRDHTIDATLRHYSIAQPYLLAVGRLIERKGFDTLIEAFSSLDQTKFSDLDLVIIGDGPDLARLTQVAEDNLVATSVTFLRNVPDKHLPPLYAGARLLALTPRETATDMEGFGIVYLEAASQGIPSIATRTGGAREAVKDNETGLLVDPDNVEQLTAALTKLLEDKDLRTRLGQTAQQQVQSARWPDRIKPLENTIADRAARVNHKE